MLRHWKESVFDCHCVRSVTRYNMIGGAGSRFFSARVCVLFVRNHKQSDLKQVNVSRRGDRKGRERTRLRTSPAFSLYDKRSLITVNRVSASWVIETCNNCDRGHYVTHFPLLLTSLCLYMPSCHNPSQICKVSRLLKEVPFMAWSLCIKGVLFNDQGLT